MNSNRSLFLGSVATFLGVATAAFLLEAAWYRSFVLAWQHAHEVVHFSWAAIASGLKWGAANLVTAFLVAAFCQKYLNESAEPTDMTEGESGNSYNVFLVLALSVPLFAASEEVMLRWALQDILGFKLTVLLFALCHCRRLVDKQCSPPKVTWNWKAPLLVHTVTGSFFGGAVLANHGNLLPAIVAHVLINEVSVLAMFAKKASDRRKVMAGDKGTESDGGRAE